LRPGAHVYWYEVMAGVTCRSDIYWANNKYKVFKLEPYFCLSHLLAKVEIAGSFGIRIAVCLPCYGVVNHRYVPPLLWCF
jgi:hypothetical protein